MARIIEGRFKRKMGIRFKAKPYSFENQGCEHNQTQIDGKEHRLECRDCQAILDPLTFLKRFAKREQELDWRIAMIREYEKKEKQKNERRKQLRENKQAKAPSK